MNVHLTPELTQLVQTKVQSGRYNSASEVVREALRLMEQKDELRTITKRIKALADAGPLSMEQLDSILREWVVA